MEDSVRFILYFENHKELKLALSYKQVIFF